MKNNNPKKRRCFRVVAETVDFAVIDFYASDVAAANERVWEFDDRDFNARSNGADGWEIKSVEEVDPTDDIFDPIDDSIHEGTVEPKGV